MSDPSDRNNSVYIVTETTQHPGYPDTRVITHPIYYVGRGKWARVKSITGYNPEVTALFASGPHIVKLPVGEHLTLDEAQYLEAKLIKINKNNGILLNRREELTDNKFAVAVIDNLSDAATEDDFIKARAACLRGKDIITPEPIINEWLSHLPDNKRRPTGDGRPMKFEVLDAYPRDGGSFKYLHDFNHFVNITGIFDDPKKLADGINTGNMGNFMSQITIKNGDFLSEQFAPSKKRYDLVIVNPPFKTIGEDFIQRCAILVKDKGYLCVVMSPIWRAMVSDRNRSAKTYDILCKNGGFHFIHMYSANDTNILFGQNIGQVDTFVWQKGTTITNTKIVNTRGDEYFVDLANYPQTPPVLPSNIYDNLFDQVNGVKWYMYPINGNGPKSTSDNDKQIYNYTDAVTGKDFCCCQNSIDKSQGKKVLIDSYITGYYVDDIGNVVSNCNRVFFYKTNEVRDNIIKALQWVVDNSAQDLFVVCIGRKKHAFIPGIRVS